MARILQETALLGRRQRVNGVEGRCRVGIREGVSCLAVLVVVPQWWLFHGRYPAQFPEIFPAPCVKSANSTLRFSDT